MKADNEECETIEIMSKETEVLLGLPHHELEDYIREARSTMDNAQMIHDRLRAVRMEKIRSECILRRTDKEALND